jgi:S1-C subfamily serine protease
MKKIFNIFAILIIGALGGIIFQAFILPHLANHEYFSEWSVVKNLKREAIINPIEKIIIEENQFFNESYEKAKKILVRLNNGCGFIATSDGLIVTLAESLSKAGEEYLFLGEEKVVYEIIKIDYDKNLALLKIEKNNLPTRSFASFNSIKTAQPVFLAGLILEEAKTKEIFNQGVIKTVDNSFIRTSIFEDDVLQGTPLFNLKGEIIGINDIDNQGKVTALAVDEIRKFSGF